LVHATNLTKRYGRLTALHNVSFSIREGEILGLIGPNGSGKTTLFECLGGVLPIDGGMVLQDGRPLTPRDRASSLFYLPDGIAPWPSQTVRWALEFIASFFGSSFDVRRSSSDAPRTTHDAPRTTHDAPRTTHDARRTTNDIIRDLDLEPLLDVTIGALSKGQRKRALLAMGLLIPRPILLADEPFEGLDLRQSRDVAQTLRRHAAGGRTMFLSIHQIGDAARVCDRFVLLSGGRVCGEGTLPELSALAAARSGSAPTDDLEEVFLALT
jgi:ABC-2 type transport system ATP-binding protein